MKHPVLALLALCGLCPVTTFLASEVYQADHFGEANKMVSYTPSDVAALTALIDQDDDLLARGRNAAVSRPSGLIRPKTRAEAGRIIAGMGL